MHVDDGQSEFLQIENITGFSIMITEYSGLRIDICIFCRHKEHTMTYVYKIKYSIEVRDSSVEDSKNGSRRLGFLLDLLPGTLRQGIYSVRNFPL